jgi:hypothetical protein
VKLGFQVRLIFLNDESSRLLHFLVSDAAHGCLCAEKLTESWY